MNSTRFGVLAAALLVAAACSDAIPDGDTLQNTLSGTVSLGAPVSNASITIAALQPDGTAGAVLATAISDAHGEFSATYARTAATYTLVCASGGLSTDLATARPLNLVSTTLCAAMASRASAVAVTAWSTLALTLAQQRAASGAAIADAVISAKADWNQYLACSDASRNVVDAVPKNPTGEDAAGALDETLLSGLSHAALSQSAALVSERYHYTPGVRFTPLSLLSGAVQDLQTDGILNGQNNATVTIQDYVFTADTFRGAPEGVAAGLQAFVASPINTSGAAQTDIDTYAGCISVSQSPIFGGDGDHDAPVITLVELLPSTVIDGVQTIHGPTTLKIRATDGSGIATIVATSTVLTLGPDTATDPAQAIYTFDTAGAPDGQTVIAIAVTDNAGNIATRDVTVHVSNAPPAVTLDGGAARFVTSASFQATGTVANPSAIASLAFTINGTIVAQLDQPSSSWSQDLTMTCDTSASLLVVATDVVGNTSTLSQTVSCDAYNPEITKQASQYYPVDRVSVTPNPAGDSLTYLGAAPVAIAGFDFAQTDGSGAVFTAFANRLDYLPSQGRTEITNNLPYLAFTVGDTGGGAASILTPPDQLTVDYRYLVNEVESRAWTPITASSAVLKLPLSYQTLSAKLVSGPQDVHHVQVRVTDAAGRATTQDYYFRLTAYLPPVVANSCAFAVATANVGFGFVNTAPKVYYELSGTVPFAELKLSLPLDLPAGSAAPLPTVTVSGSASALSKNQGVGIIIDSPSASASACTSPTCLSGCGGGLTSSVPPLAGSQCIPATPQQYQLWKANGVYSYSVGVPAWFTQPHVASLSVGPTFGPAASIATVTAGGSLFARVSVDSPRFAIDGVNTSWPTDPSASIYMGTGAGYSPAGGQTTTYRVRYYLTTLSQQGDVTGLVLAVDGFLFPSTSLVRTPACLGGVARTIHNTLQWPDS